MSVNYCYATAVKKFCPPSVAYCYFKFCSQVFSDIGLYVRSYSISLACRRRGSLNQEGWLFILNKCQVEVMNLPFQTRVNRASVNVMVEGHFNCMLNIAIVCEKSALLLFICSCATENSHTKETDNNWLLSRVDDMQSTG